MFTDMLKLEVTTRPARALLLVNSQKEFSHAVKLATHVWGGRLHAILPTPKGSVQESGLRRAIHRLDPDIVLTIDRGLFKREARCLSGSARRHVPITSKSIEAHANAREALRIGHSVLPHCSRILAARHPEGLSSSGIRIVRPKGDRLSSHAALFGVIASRYERYLQEGLAAEMLEGPEDGGAWLRMSLLRRGFSYPPDVAAMGCSVTRTFPNFPFGGSSRSVLESPRASSSQFLWIFTPHQEDLKTLCAFWNASHRLEGSMALVPLRELRSNPMEALEDVILLTEPRQVVLVSSIKGSWARPLRQEILTAIGRVADGIEVAVLTDRFVYAVPTIKVRAGQSRAFRLAKGRNSRVGFPVDPPEGVGGRDEVFGLDVEVESDVGERLRFPDLEPIARCLMNEEVRLERADQDVSGAGRLWLRQGDPVRPGGSGICGLLRPGREFEFFLHEEGSVVDRAVRSPGIKVQGHRHRRYVRGFLRRFGGLRTSLDLVRRRGHKILKALAFDKSEEPGLVRNRIQEKLKREYGFDGEGLRDLLNETLPALLGAGLVRRGIQLRCTDCDLSQWHAVEELSEVVRCEGCFGEIQLRGGGVSYSFRINELAGRLMRSGGDAVLECVATLKAIEPSIAVSFGAEVELSDGTEAEVDVMAVTPLGLLFAECKAVYDYDTEPNSMARVRESAEKLINVCKLAGVSQGILAIATEGDVGAARAEIRGLAAEARAEQVEMHGVVNQDFLLEGRELVDPRAISFTGWPETPRPTRCYGDVIKSYGIGSSALDVGRIRDWEKEFRV